MKYPYKETDNGLNRTGRIVYNENIRNINSDMKELDERIERIVSEDSGNSEVVDARTDVNGEVSATVKERLDKDQLALAQLADESIDVNSFWVPPTQPGTDWGTNGVPSVRDPETVINALYEPFRQNHPDYVTRTLIGPSTVAPGGDGQVYNIYEYQFTPKNFTNTLILSAGTHGNEYSAFFALWRFLYHLVNDHEKYPQLNTIRKNVRVIVLPLINPWGFKNSKRQNANLVDLNRNTDYLWDTITGSKFQVGGANYKGTAPFSEKESQYFKQTIQKYSDAKASIDFHTITTVFAEHIVYTPRYMNQFRHIFNDVIAWLYKPGDRIVNGTSAVPTLSCWAGYNHHMTVANPEWYNRGYNGENRGSQEMTEIVKYFGNIAIEASKLQHKTDVLDASEKTTLLMYDKTTNPPITLGVSQTNSFNNIKHLTYGRSILRHGTYRANGTMQVSVSAPATVEINTVLYQQYHPEFSFSKVQDAPYGMYKKDMVPGTIYDVPIRGTMNVFPTNYNETGEGETQRTADAKFRVRGRISTGTLTIEGFRVELTYKPNDSAKPFEIVNYTGLEAMDEGLDYKIEYPDATKFDTDSSVDE